MPLLKISANIRIPTEDQIPLLKQTSIQLAKLLGKPERYVMTSLVSEQTMTFGGSSAPLAYLELKSLGLQGDQTRTLSKALCEIIESSLSIPQDRIYIEFSGPQRSMWGWNGDTFER
ncbi:MAG: hypothetical protein GY696_01115 [Gammaproteobacteria bacterium]|nr:hypothetical protein [Gammaproteobacteria bacterium]